MQLPASTPFAIEIGALTALRRFALMPDLLLMRCALVAIFLHE